MKITCTSCGTAYEVDDAQIPPGGLTIQCSTCQATMNLRRPDSAQETRYYVRRSSGNVFGPFLEKAIISMLEQQKLEGSEEVSTDGNNWVLMSQVPALASATGSGPGVSAAAPLVPPPPTGPSDIPDLPAPKAGPRPRAAGPAGSPAGGPPPIDLSDLDQGPAADPLDLADLPAPKASSRPIIPSAPPGIPAEPPDLADLPAPKASSRPIIPSAPPGIPAQPPDLADLPAPKGRGPIVPPAPPPKIPAEPLDLADLPAPKGSITDLPAPKAGITDLPEPKGGISDLPAPRGGLADLASAEHHLSHGQIELTEDEEMADLDDLPVSAGVSVGLELDTDFDLPAPKEPVGASGMDHGMDHGMDQDDIDVVAPKPPVDQGAVDVVAPKGPIIRDSGEEASVSLFKPPVFETGDQVAVPQTPVERVEKEPAFVAPEPEEIVRKRPRLTKRTLLMIGAGLGCLILVAGLALGFVTDYGFFAIDLLTGAYDEGKQAERLIESGTLAMRADTFKAYKKAHDDFEAAAKKMDAAPLPVALQIQAAAALTYRFGPNMRMRSTARDLLSRLERDSSEPFPNLEKAKGLVALALARIPEATKELTAISDQEPGDAQAAVYLGWTQLAKGKMKAALSSFSRALAKDPGHAAAMFGTAQIHHQMNKAKAALSWANKTLGASPRHPGALLLKSSIFQQTNKIAQAEKTLKLAMTARGLASRSEFSRIQSSLGELALLSGRADDARKLFQKALKIDPRSIDALLGMGKIFLSARQLKRAMDIYDKAQLISPNNIHVTVMVARTQIALGKPLRAQKTLQRIKKAAPDTPEIFFLLGQVEASVNNTASAEKNFLAAIKKKPSYFPSYLHLSRLYLRQEKVDEALAVLSKADSQLLGSPLVRNAEGEIYLATDKLDMAQTKFEEALRLDADFNEALFNLARCLQKQGKLEEAKDRYLALQKKDKSFPRLAEHMASLLIKLEQYSAAAESYDQALMIDNPEVKLRLDATRGYLLAGQNKKALQQTEEILRDDPTIAYARAMRAEAFLAMGSFPEARIEIGQAISREKKTEYFVTRGQIYEKEGNKDAAIKSYSQVLKMDPSRLDIRYRRATLLIKSQAIRDALKDLQSVIKKMPEMAEAWVYLGDIYAELNQESKALKAYRTAVSKDNKQARGHFKIGEFLFDQRNMAAAYSHLSLATQLGKPDDEWLPDAYHMLATTALNRGNKKAAIAAFKAYLKIAPPKAGMRRQVLKELSKLGVIEKQKSFTNRE